MTRFQRIKINNQKVHPLRTPGDDDHRPPRGQELFKEAYANIFFCAKKKSGKTQAVAKTILNCAGKDTKVYVFCSTVYIDPAYIEMGKILDRRNISFYPSTSIYDGKHDLLQDILAEEENFLDEGDEHPTVDAEPKQRLLDLSERTPKKKKKKKSKFKELRSIFVFDDLSTEIRHSNTLKRLLKLNRHILCTTLIRSQWVNDLDPQSIGQLDYTLIFKAHSIEKLIELHKKLDLSIDVNEFINLYKTITQDKTKFNFMYITRFDELRENFNILLKPEDD